MRLYKLAPWQLLSACVSIWDRTSALAAVVSQPKNERCYGVQLESKSNKKFLNACSICFKFSFYSFLWRFVFPAFLYFHWTPVRNWQFLPRRPSLALTHQQRPFLLLLLHLSLLVTIGFPQATIQDFHLGVRIWPMPTETINYCHFVLHVSLLQSWLATRCKRENHELNIFWSPNVFGLCSFLTSEVLIWSTIQ